MQTFRIQLLDEDCMPERNHESDACFDVKIRCIRLCYNGKIKNKEQDSLLLLPHERVLCPLGFKLSLQENWEALIRPRSGLAAKHGVTVANTPGTVDSFFRGEVAAIIQNNSTDLFTLEKGMRIAQMAIRKYDSVDLIPQVEDLDETERGEKGFGSSGV